MNCHDRTRCLAECFKLFERGIRIPADQFIQRLEGSTLKDRPPVPPGQRRGLAGLTITEKPALKGAQINSVEFSDLSLGSLMVQVGRNGPLTCIGSGGFFHAAEYNIMMRHLNS